ncbi:glycosyltransferase family 2 protein [Candidatus Borrarchaeum sp.]|uniref:glycosyltransferase n=1 Tax=Candidatus Borrarchaeum sp. TaxID=2846742 RepID=UPI00257CC1CF|nr:glycosyltransferase [Candidatus Borrarchaeum sp.]
MNGQKTIPLVTIAMPIKNREWCIDSVLDAIVKDEYPKKRIRFVFVDNMSSDNTYAMLLEFKNNFAHEYEDVILLKDDGNLPQLRNICIDKSSESDFLLFLDSDVIVKGSNTIKRMISLFEDETVGMVFIPYLPKGGITELHDRIWALKEKKIQNVQEVGMGLTMIRTSVIPTVGIFDKDYHMTEDCEFSSRVIAKGYKIVKISEDPAIHLHVEPIDYFQKLFMNMAPFRWKVIKKTYPKRYIYRLILYSLLITSILIIPIQFPLTLIPFILIFSTIYVFHLVRMQTIYGKLIAPPFFIVSGIILTLGIYRAMLIDLKNKIKGGF